MVKKYVPSVYKCSHRANAPARLKPLFAHPTHPAAINDSPASFCKKNSLAVSSHRISSLANSKNPVVMPIASTTPSVARNIFRPIYLLFYCLHWKPMLSSRTAWEKDANNSKWLKFRAAPLRVTSQTQFSALQPFRVVEKNQSIFINFKLPDAYRISFSFIIR